MNTEAPSLRKLPFFLWGLASWLALAGLIYGLNQHLTDEWLLVLGSGSFALPFALRAIHSSRNCPRFLRVIFWVGELVGVFLLSVTVDQNQDAIHRSPILNEFPKAGMALFIVCLLWAWVRIARRERAGDALKRGRLWWVVDCGYGALWLIVIPAIAYLFLEYVYIPQATRAAEKKWAEIGRPMEEFDKQFKPIAENASLRELGHDLEPFGIQSLYRHKDGEDDPNHFDIPGPVMKVLNQITTSKQDQLILDAIPEESGTHSRDLEEATQFLAAHATDLDQLYLGVLRREPPVWEYDPSDFWGQKVPNYLVARKLAQLVTVDACLKLRRGDTQGANTAVTAMQRIVTNLYENPYMVSFMIGIAIDALLDGNAAVRLPEAPDTLKNLQAEVESKRQHVLTILQSEARFILRATHYPEHLENQFGPRTTRSHLSEKILAPVSRAFLQIYAVRAARILAMQSEVYKNSQTLPDRGVAEIDRINRENPTIAGPNIFRALLRSQFCFLLHEESAVLRAARTQMAAGKTDGEWPSTAVPGSKWVVIGDATEHSVKLKLSPTPKWVEEREVVDDVFFPVVPDGNKSWEFAPAL